MSKYEKVIEKVFLDNYKEGLTRVAFNREELAQAWDDLGIKRTKNLGDIAYTYRFRKELPASIKSTAPEGTYWIIIGNGIGTYEFKQAVPIKIEPTNNRQKIKILDATPETFKIYALGTDEQALLTKVKYKRLVDLFTELTCYSI